MNGSFLLKGGCVLTLGPRTPNHTEADVLIEDGIVAEVGPGLRSRTAEVVDVSNTIVMPGFVDAHRRCWPSLFKNEGVRVRDGDPAPDDVYAGTLVALLGAVEAGITTVVDWYDGPIGDDHIDAALQAHSDAGLRTVLAVAPHADPVAAWRGTVAGHGTAPTPLATLAAGAPSVAAGPADRVASEWGAAREAGMRIHTVAGPSESGRLADLGRRGVLGPDVTVAHCTGLSDEDLDAISAASAGVALTPVSDMTTGPGSPPLQAFIDRGIRPGLGVDDELSAPGDILAQMRSAISIQHATYFDLKLAGKGGLPNLLTTRDVIKYGTIDGARAVGLESVTGSIEAGKAADVIVLRTDRPNIFPVNDPIGAVVWGVDTSNLDWVFVGGRPLMRGGVIEADVARAAKLVVAARRRMGAAMEGVTEAVSGGHP